MDAYEKLLVEFSEELIFDDFANLPNGLKGFYAVINNRKLVLLSKNLRTVKEKVCILAEEMGHHYTTVGDITDQSKVINRKQEERARRWAAKRIVSLNDLVQAYELGIRSKVELADYLNITEEFLTWAIDYYRKKYGYMTVVDEKYIVYFEPFGVMKLI